MPHPGVVDELAGPVSEQVDEQLDDEDEAEGHVEVVGHQPQPRARPARHAIQHRGGFRWCGCMRGHERLGPVPP